MFQANGSYESFSLPSLLSLSLCEANVSYVHKTRHTLVLVPVNVKKDKWALTLPTARSDKSCHCISIVLLRSECVSHACES